MAAIPSNQKNLRRPCAGVPPSYPLVTQALRALWASAGKGCFLLQKSEKNGKKRFLIDKTVQIKRRYAVLTPLDLARRDELFDIHIDTSKRILKNHHFQGIVIGKVLDTERDIYGRTYIQGHSMTWDGTHIQR